MCLHLHYRHVSTSDSVMMPWHTLPDLLLHPACESLVCRAMLFTFAAQSSQVKEQVFVAQVLSHQASLFRDVTLPTRLL